MSCYLHERLCFRSDVRDVNLGARVTNEERVSRQETVAENPPEDEAARAIVMS